MAYWLDSVRAHPEFDQSPRLRKPKPALSSSRARLRFALIVVLAIAGILNFAIFPAHSVDVTADGESVQLVSRESDTRELLELAGVQTQAGDVLLKQGEKLIIERAIPVRVEVDGLTLGWRTRARTVDDLLTEMGVSVSQYDGISYNGIKVGLGEELVPEENINISIVRAVPVTIVEDGTLIEVQSPDETLAQVLADAGIELGPADVVMPPPETPVEAGMVVNVDHARAITLQTGEGSHILYTHKATLGEALAEVGLSFGEEDRVEPGLDTEVTNGMSARLVRVSGRSFFEREQVLRKTVFTPDPSLSGFETRRVEGSNGTLVREYHIAIEDGVETEKTLVNEGFDPAPVDNVIYYAPTAVGGSGISPQDLAAAQTMHVYATWYNAASSGKAATHPAYGITRSGVPVTRGIVATDPSVIPLGTRLYIPGYGFAVAGDTGGGIIGNMIDLGFPDGVQVDWHTGWVDIYILAP